MFYRIGTAIMVEINLTKLVQVKPNSVLDRVGTVLMAEILESWCLALILYTDYY